MKYICVSHEACISDNCRGNKPHALIDLSKIWGVHSSEKFPKGFFCNNSPNGLCYPVKYEEYDFNLPEDLFNL